MFLASVAVPQAVNATGVFFEFIYSKKRSRLEHSRLNDLVFVRYNLKLQERILRKSRAALDPISLDNIDLLGEWVSEEPALLDGDDFNWESIDAPFATMSVSEEEELASVADPDVAPTLKVQPICEETEDGHMFEPPADQDPSEYVQDAAD